MHSFTFFGSLGLGYADLENRVPCSPETLLRIASISKPLTSAAAARLCEEGKLDLDVPVQKYVPEFPKKKFDGEDVSRLNKMPHSSSFSSISSHAHLFFQVTITPRMLLSHLSGIRHYEKDAQKVKEKKEKSKRLLKAPIAKKEDVKNSPVSNNKPGTEQDTDNKKATETRKKKEFEHEEYYLKDKFESVIQGLDLFKDDPLIFKPGMALVCV